MLTLSCGLYSENDKQDDGIGNRHEMTTDGNTNQNTDK